MKTWTITAEFNETVFEFEVAAEDITKAITEGKVKLKILNQPAALIFSVCEIED